MKTCPAPSHIGRLAALAGFLVGVLVLFGMVSASGRMAAPAGSSLPLDVAGCTVFPADNIWNVPVDTLPVHPRSATYIATIGTSAYVHADFGSGLWDGGPIGIPYTSVPGSQPMVPVTFGWPEESDAGPYPVPPNVPIEGGSNSDGDRHVLVVDRDSCILYELYYAFPQSNGASWTAGSGAIFNLRSNALRPAGWTSADAAGLAILAGLVRYDEVAAGEIRHALRFTALQTRREYIWPARHYASDLTGAQYPPMGLRVRLKANYDISGFAPEVQVVLRALKKYGMILADNGSSWYISGVPDERWDNDHLHQLHQVLGSAFEAVDESSLMVSADSGQARSAASAPTPTATRSTTATHSQASSPTVTGTPTALRSQTTTSTPTPTLTLTPSKTRTPTQTPTPSHTATRTLIRSVTPTSSVTPTETAAVRNEMLWLPLIVGEYRP